MALLWTYKGKQIQKVDDVFEVDEALKQKCEGDKYKLYGFIYKVNFPDNKFYIGKCNFFYLRTLKSRVSKLPRAGHIQYIKRIINHHKVEHEVFKQENEWQEYQGSAKFCKEHDALSKEMLEITLSKRYLTYLEIKYQFLYNVLEDINAINDNISGRFFKGNLDKDEIKDYSHLPMGEHIPGY